MQADQARALARRTNTGGASRTTALLRRGQCAKGSSCRPECSAATPPISPLGPSPWANRRREVVQRVPSRAIGSLPRCDHPKKCVGGGNRKPPPSRGAYDEHALSKLRNPVLRGVQHRDRGAVLERRHGSRLARRALAAMSASPSSLAPKAKALDVLKQGTLSVAPAARTRM